MNFLCYFRLFVAWLAHESEALAASGHGRWANISQNIWYLSCAHKEAPHLCAWSVIWLIYARDSIILIFSTRNSWLRTPVVQRALLKMWLLFREMDFKARDYVLESHKNAVFRRCEGCSLKTFSRGKPPILLTSLAIKPTLGNFVC